MSRVRRVVAGLLGGVVAVGGLVLGAAAPAAAADCTASSGVRVVVDLGAFGGGVQTRCAPGDPTTGRQALTSAGFALTDVPRQPGFICTIAGQPNPCNMAPASAYWSYWLADAGGTWSYSNWGASNRDPAPGTVEGWAFGAGSPPSVSPPAADVLAAPPPPPPPAPEAAAPPGPAGASPSGRSPAAPPSVTDAAADPSAADPAADPAEADPSAAAPATDPAAAPAATDPSAASPTADASPSTSPPGSGSSSTSDGEPSEGPTDVRSDPASASSPVENGTPVGTLVAVTLVLVLASAAGTVAARRRGGASR